MKIIDTTGKIYQGIIPKAQIFTSSGTWIFGAEWVWVTLVGGGGGGGASGNEGGGGGGEVIYMRKVRVTGDVTLTIGAGGAAETNGGDSTFGSIITADHGDGTANTSGAAGGGVLGGASVASDTVGNTDIHSNNPYGFGGGGGGGGANGDGGNSAFAFGGSANGGGGGGASWGNGANGFTGASANTGGGGGGFGVGGSGYGEVYWFE